MIALFLLPVIQADRLLLVFRLKLPQERLFAITMEF